MNAATTLLWRSFSEAGAVSEGNMVELLPGSGRSFIEMAYGLADFIFYTQ